jgi:hypothetical protein
MAQDQSRVQQLMGDIAPKLAELTDEVLFGDVWARPGLSQRDRSLITVAALTALARTDQLASHMGRALDNGVTPHPPRHRRPRTRAVGGGTADRDASGGTVYTPPGVWHWHGALPTRFTAHLALADSCTEPGARGRPVRAGTPASPHRPRRSRHPVPGSRGAHRRFIPVATRAYTLTTRVSSRTFTTRAST